jgi:hypothetical protein
MKFSINNLLSKYNLVLIISILFILFVVYIVLNVNSYKEHMDNNIFKNTRQNNEPEVDRQPKVDRQSVEIIPEIEIPKSDPIVSTNLFIPVCTLLNKNDCSKNKYCNWNSNKKLCNKLDVCDFLDKNRCTNSNNCSWDDGRNSCLYN